MIFAFAWEKWRSFCVLLCIFFYTIILQCNSIIEIVWYLSFSIKSLLVKHGPYRNMYIKSHLVEYLSRIKAMIINWPNDFRFDWFLAIVIFLLKRVKLWIARSLNSPLLFGRVKKREEGCCVGVGRAFMIKSIAFKENRIRQKLLKIKRRCFWKYKSNPGISRCPSLQTTVLSHPFSSFFHNRNHYSFTITTKHHYYSTTLYTPLSIKQ